MISASEGMDDVALKPKLLRSLLREYVPDEKHPFSSHSELLYVVSTVKTHKLLSEWAPQSVGQDLVDAWKLAVDSWVHRLLTLASSNLPDKCWAGVCLLGLTCQECSSERFLASYTDCLNELLSHIQRAAVSHFVKAASLASLSDLFTRLSAFSNAKKDGTSLAAKVIQPAVNKLNEDSSVVVLAESICVFCTLIKIFPFSIQRHYNSVEAAIVLKLISGKCCASVLKRLGYILSLLPKSRGDEDSWSLMMDKILLYINSQLNDAFQALEEGIEQIPYSISDIGRKNIAWSFSFRDQKCSNHEGIASARQRIRTTSRRLAVSEQTTDLSTRRPERLLGTRISTLMQCCCNMLTSSYPVMVVVPISGLIALAGRVLMVDGSLSASYSFMSTLKQEFICSEIPLLQLHSLEILTAIVKGLSSQLLPHAAGVVQLLKEYLNRCKFPVLKIKAYSLLKVLLMSMGVGIVIHIGQDIVSNVFIDLDFFGAEKDGKSSGQHTKVYAESLSEFCQKKRKHSSLARSFKEQPAHDGIEAEISHNLTPIALKIAALEALEALLTVGGFIRSESWRGIVDHLLITVATNACKGGWSSDERSIFLSGDTTRVDFQRTALRALLASLISPGQVRASHLALGLELFRRGAQETSTKLADYCGHALLALEVLIHPRSLPLVDLHSSPDEYKGLNHKLSLEKGPPEPESEDDDLDKNWLGNDYELEIQVTKRQHDDPSSDELPSVKDTSITHLPEETEATVSASVPNDKIIANNHDYMVESQHLRKAVDDHVGKQPGLINRSLLAQNDSIMNSDGISEVHKGVASTSKQPAMETEDDRFTTIVERISDTLSNSDRNKGLMFEAETELSDDSLPDIVDGDPDSD